VLPLQIFLIGDLAIAALPSEFTTVAGRRLRATLLETLRPRGVVKVVLTSYANAYSGYVCTREEYAHQRYEASHTVFGKWTLAAYRSEFRELARRLVARDEQRAPVTQPTGVSARELSRRLHDGPFKSNARQLRALERARRDGLTQRP
jgi:neutral ceramidase